MEDSFTSMYQAKSKIKHACNKHWNPNYCCKAIFKIKLVFLIMLGTLRGKQFEPSRGSYVKNGMQKKYQSTNYRIF